jgi:hypothetical protein
MIISDGSNLIKPPQWAIDPGVVACNAQAMGLPMPVAVSVTWEGGGTPFDLSGNHHWTFLGNSIWAADGVRTNENVIEIPTLFRTTQLTAFTFFIRVRFIAFGTTAMLYWYGSDFRPSGICQMGTSGDYFRVKFSVHTDVNYYQPNSPYVFQNGETCNIVHRCDGATTKGYKNGVEIASLEMAGTLTTADGNFGFSDNAYPADIVICSFAAWDQALSQSQIATISADPYGLVREPEIGLWLYDTPAAGGVAPTSTLYGPLVGPLGGPI